MWRGNCSNNGAQTFLETVTGEKIKQLNVTDYYLEVCLSNKNEIYRLNQFVRRVDLIRITLVLKDTMKKFNLRYFWEGSFFFS